jgi:hypothetical protein
MTEFEVHGPYEIPISKGVGGSTFTSANGKQFWKNHSTLANRKGVYVFAFQAAKGFVPWYVGKTKVKFDSESFTADKIAKYNIARTKRKTKTPMMFLLVYPITPGKISQKKIDDLETFLIQTGKAINPELLNKKKIKGIDWSIAGILRNGPGQPTKSQQKLKRLFNWTQK